MNAAPYPLTFHPVYKDYLWGGTRIPTLFQRPPRAGISAESWEISTRPEGMSIVSNGPAAGTSLETLSRQWGKELLGSDCPGNTFPLLIKIIDAKLRLSVQVHPNDDNADATGGDPKTEMWYVLDAEPGSMVFAGLQQGVSHETFRAAIRDNQVPGRLLSLPVKPDTAIFIPGGCVHAIGEGCLLLEIQQNSNTTYRVYDWDRRDAQGNAREIHVEEAMKTIDWDRGGSRLVTPANRRDSGNAVEWDIIACPFFRVNRLDLLGDARGTNDGRSFHALFVREGRIVIRTGDDRVECGPGTSCLLPAAVSEYSLSPLESSATVIRITL